jgi:hypothetical protein
MAAIMSIAALAVAGMGQDVVAQAATDRSGVAVPSDPPCVTTCTAAERRRMDREAEQLKVYLAKLRTWSRWARTILPYRSWLGRLRACESNGNWRIVNSLGYAGAYQFGGWAWDAAGGTGRPQDAHPLEQSYRAVVLRQAYGLSQWECKVGS